MGQHESPNDKKKNKVKSLRCANSVGKYRLSFLVMGCPRDNGNKYRCAKKSVHSNLKVWKDEQLCNNFIHRGK